MSLAGALASHERANGSYLVKRGYTEFVSAHPDLRDITPDKLCAAIHKAQLEIAESMHLKTANIRQIEPQLIEDLWLLSQEGGTLIMRHGEQKTTGTVDSFISEYGLLSEGFPDRAQEDVNAALKKISMMLKENNQSDGITGESEIELLGLKIVMEYLAARGIQLKVISSNTPRALIVAKSLSEEASTEDHLDCIDYRAPESAVEVKTMLTDMPSGGIPWADDRVFKKYARDGKGDPVSPGYMRLSMAPVSDAVTSQSLRIVITHTQQMNAVFDNFGKGTFEGKFSRFGHFGFIAAPNKGEPSQYLDGVFTKERKLRDLKEAGRAITRAAEKPPTVKKYPSGTFSIPITSPKAGERKRKNGW